MARDTVEIPFDAAHLAHIKLQMLNWSSKFGICLFLDSNEYPDPHGKYECLLAAGAIKTFSGENRQGLENLQDYLSTHQDWIFGHLAYELKDVFEPTLSSTKRINYGFQPFSFFVPEIVLQIPKGKSTLRVESLGASASSVVSEVLAQTDTSSEMLPKISFKSRLNREEYLKMIETLRQHIYDGDCYEITFCNESFSKGTIINPLEVFQKLNKASPAPFAAFYRLKSLALMCSSPERFLQRNGSEILSQPIKGTTARGATKELDNELKAVLAASEKERAENVMIVDLVRNDLAKVSVPGSVEVEELFGVYTFPAVHQLISTISGKLRDKVSLVDILAATFPMGSMTGAPKHRVMQFIEDYETVRRELFSGSVGYISPNGDFDFNVIIRSLFYNEVNTFLSYQTGGAITWGSIPEQEWEEARLKAVVMEQIFEK
ncbi:MAG: anthranilate synthase component I family protein [Chitinophagaceae bacterium]